MAKMGDNSSGSSNDTGCQAAIDAEIFDLGCLGPALAIIVLLAFLQRRKNLKLGCCSGYPGLVIPFNFLRGFRNRFTIAATFGATASTCLELFTKGATLFHILGDTPWLRVFQGLLAVLIYGILFYPLFACLTTDNKLLGSILGFLYGAVRFSVKLATEFQCANDNDGDESDKRPYLTLIGLLPTYLCLLVVNIRFAVLLVLEIRKTGFQFFHSISERYRECSDTILIESPGVEHIKNLFYPGGNSCATHANEKWYLRVIHFIYKPRADFKFSTQFISTLMVAAIVIFQLLVSFVGPFAVCEKTLTKTYCSNDSCKDFLGVIFGSLQTAYIFSWFISAILLLHFMKCHRSHVLQLYQGNKAFYQQVEVSPTTLVERSILFSGYQVAYTIAGYMVLGLSLAVVCVILGLIVKYWNDIIDQEQLKKFVLTALPTAIIAIVLWCFQLFLGHFVFRDRTLPKITITVNNRRLYSIISYFFFFYNVLVGLFSCLLRIFKGTVLGVLFLGRIDRTVLMQGFQTWDPAFVAYLGFINVLVAHSHPVVLMFCQLLINRHNNRCFESENSLTNICSLECESSYECGSADEKFGILSDKGSFKTYDAHYTRNLRNWRLSVTAVNRWHVAVTLLRNPSLIKYRKQRSKDSVKPLLSLGSINSDVIASV